MSSSDSIEAERGERSSSATSPSTSGARTTASTARSPDGAVRNTTADKAWAAQGPNLVDARTMEDFRRLVGARFGSFRAWALDAGLTPARLDDAVRMLTTSR